MDLIASLVPGNFWSLLVECATEWCAVFYVIMVDLQILFLKPRAQPPPQLSSFSGFSGTLPPAALQIPVLPIAQRGPAPTRVLRLSNMVTPSEIEIDDDYAEIMVSSPLINLRGIFSLRNFFGKFGDECVPFCIALGYWQEDVREECSKFGAVVSVLIPRPASCSGGIGKVFVLFAEAGLFVWFMCVHFVCTVCIIFFCILILRHGQLVLLLLLTF